MQNSFYRKTATDVEFQIKKDQPESWPRLTGERVKLPWLKIDFDKFLVDDESDEEKAQQSVSNLITGWLFSFHFYVSVCIRWFQDSECVCVWYEK